MISIETTNDYFEMEDDRNYTIEMNYIPNFTKISAIDRTKVEDGEIKVLILPNHMIESITID